MINRIKKYFRIYRDSGYAKLFIKTLKHSLDYNTGVVIHKHETYFDKNYMSRVNLTLANGWKAALHIKELERIYFMTAWTGYCHSTVWFSEENAFQIKHLLMELYKKQIQER